MSVRSVWMFELDANTETLQKQVFQLLPELLTSARICHQLFKTLYFEFEEKDAVSLRLYS